MKGMLVKDFRLLGQRKRFFLLMTLCGVCMSFGMDGSGFIVGWMTMVATLFSLSTLSYDEYDNCMPFLMSMPVSPKEYAAEKYLFGFLCGISGWLLAVVIELGSMLVRHVPFRIGEEILMSCMFLPLMMIMLSLCLPIDLKWGLEKGRLVLFLIYGIVFGAIPIIQKKTSVSSSNLLSDFAQTLGSAKPAALLLVFVVIASAAVALSLRISIRIMSKKEF